MEWYYVWLPWLTLKRVAEFVSINWASCLAPWPWRCPLYQKNANPHHGSSLYLITIDSIVFLRIVRNSTLHTYNYKIDTKTCLRTTDGHRYIDAVFRGRGYLMSERAVAYWTPWWDRGRRRSTTVWYTASTSDLEGSGMLAVRRDAGGT